MASLGPNELNHWGREQMTAILQTTFSNTFSWMKMYELQLRFHWILFPRVQLTIFQHWFRWWLGADQATSHYLNQWQPSLLMHICIFGSQWVKSCLLRWYHEILSSFMLPDGTKLQFWPNADCCQMYPKEHMLVEFESKYAFFFQENEYASSAKWYIVYPQHSGVGPCAW